MITFMKNRKTHNCLLQIQDLNMNKNRKMINQNNQTKKAYWAYLTKSKLNNKMHKSSLLEIDKK